MILRKEKIGPIEPIFSFLEPLFSTEKALIAPLILV
jgi:hypothetical protein